jgi:invasion protein IalB
MVAVAAGPAGAVGEEAGLPGGASSLRETFEDWTVTCAIQPAPQSLGTKVCAMSQDQARVAGQSRQRVLHIDLSPDGDRLRGNLVLPFGLDLAAGARLQLDDSPVGSPQTFRTCLPQGCVINLEFDAGAVAALENGNALKIHAKADAGEDIELSVSLRGFSAAYRRSIDLKT